MMFESIDEYMKGTKKFEDLQREVMKSDDNQIAFLKALYDDQPQQNVFDANMRFSKVLKLKNECMNKLILSKPVTKLTLILDEFGQDMSRIVLDHVYMNHLVYNLEIDPINKKPLEKIERHRKIQNGEDDGEPSLRDVAIICNDKPKHSEYQSMLDRAGEIDINLLIAWLTNQGEESEYTGEMISNIGDFSGKLDFLISIYADQNEYDTSGLFELIDKFINGLIVEGDPFMMEMGPEHLVQLILTLNTKRRSSKEIRLTNKIIEKFDISDIRGMESVITMMDPDMSLFGRSKSETITKEELNKAVEQILDLTRKRRILGTINRCQDDISQLLDEMPDDDGAYFLKNLALFLPTIIHEHHQNDASELVTLLQQIHDVDPELYDIDSSDTKQVKLLSNDSLYQFIHSGEHMDIDKCIEILQTRYINRSSLFKRSDYKTVNEYLTDLCQDVEHVIDMTKAKHQESCPLSHEDENQYTDIGVRDLNHLLRNNGLKEFVNTLSKKEALVHAFGRPSPTRQEDLGLSSGPSMGIR